jgi:hypothetical protein
MQMPMPQKGARTSCRTESLQGSLAVIMAAATLVPSATQTDRPLMMIRNFSLMRRTYFMTLVLAGSHFNQAGQREFPLGIAMRISESNLVYNFAVRNHPRFARATLKIRLPRPFPFEPAFTLIRRILCGC